MIFIEFGAFSRQRAEYLDDEELRALQNVLVENPGVGALIPGSGGLRKLRWAAAGRGKRGGVRVIYFPSQSHSVILLLLLYAKNQQDDLSPQQKRALRNLVDTELALRQVADEG